MTHTHNQMRFAAAAAMLLFAATGCLRENFYDPSDVLSGPKIIATIDEASEEACETRVSISEETLPTSGKIYYYWTPEDEIGVFTNASENNVRFKNTASENSKTVTFAPTTSVTGTPTYAYYPYSAEAGTDITAVKGSIPSEQTINAELDNVPGIYRYGYYKSTSGSASSFGFKHVMSTVRFHIDVAGTPLEGRKLHNLQISVKRGNVGVPVCGDFTFSAESGAHKEIKSSTSNTINVIFDGKPVLDSDITFYTTLLPNVKSGDVLYFTLNASGYTATYRVSTSHTFMKNYVYTISTTIKPYGTLKITPNEIDKPDPSELPTINSFSFEVGKNSGKLLNNELKWNSSKHTPSFSSVSTHTATINNDAEEITLTIPYLYDFKLKPTFATGESNCSVFVNGIEQKSGETEVDFSKTVTYTVKNNTNGYSRDYRVKITNTGLPVVVINQSTSGKFDKVYKDFWAQLTGGTPYNQFVDFMIRGKDTEWVEDDKITVYNPDGSVNMETTLGGVRLRGNTTQEYPKKPFAIKLSKKRSVLGMPEHKRWVLLANWLDHSMIRNSVAFDIAQVVEYAWRSSGGAIGDGIPWSVHGQNVELVFIENGTAHHVGNYYLCEQIKIDDNRLNIKDSYEDVLSTNIADCGYLLEMDSKEDNDTKYTTSNGVPVKFKDDAIKGTTLYTAVSRKIQSIEDYLDAKNYTEAYKMLDINSVIDQMLIWELAMNREYGDPGSIYMFMDGDGKLCAGPVWDFDRGTFQNQEKATDLGNSTSYRVKPDNQWMYNRSQESETYSYVWYRQLAKDPTFQQTVQQRWAVIKPYLELIPDQIRYYGETQAVSFSYDSVMWPTNYNDVRKYKSDFKDWSGDEEISDWNELINNFVTVYNERLAGMDALITSGKFTK